MRLKSLLFWWTFEGEAVQGSQKDGCQNQRSRAAQNSLEIPNRRNADSNVYIESRSTLESYMLVAVCWPELLRLCRATSCDVTSSADAFFVFVEKHLVRRLVLSLKESPTRLF